jgi:hypothetical protein
MTIRQLGQFVSPRHADLSRWRQIAKIHDISISFLAVMTVGKPLERCVNRAASAFVVKTQQDLCFPGRKRWFGLLWDAHVSRIASKLLLLAGSG